VGGDKDLRLLGSCIKGAFTKTSAIETSIVVSVTKHAFDVVEVAQLPDWVQVGIWFVEQEQAVVFAGNALVPAR
jgi:hypothetical protein